MEKYYVNITKKPVEEYNAVSIELNVEDENLSVINENSGEISIVSTPNYNELSEDLTYLRQNLTTAVNDKYNQIMNTIVEGNFVIPYCEASNSIKYLDSNDETVTITGEEIQNIKTNGILKDSTSDVFVNESSSEYCSDRWTSWGGYSLSKTDTTINLTNTASNGGVEYVNSGSERIRLTLNNNNSSSRFYANPHRADVTAQDEDDRIPSNGSLTIELNVGEKICVYTYNSGSLTYFVERADENLAISTIADLVYPIGSIYMSVESTSPATLFGGVWDKLENRFLLGASNTYPNKSTGGSAQHTLTVNEMPSHTHTQASHNHSQKSHTHTQASHRHSMHKEWSSGTGKVNGRIVTANRTIVEKYTDYQTPKINGATATNNPATAVNNNTGGGQAHNNMPPFLSVHMWKRIK